GLLDFLTATVAARPTITPGPFAGRVTGDDGGQVEWAVCWPIDEDGFVHSYCNSIPTPQGGSHDLALRSELARGMRSYAEMLGNKRAAQITADDLLGGACIMLSVFIRDPQFQGQTKEKFSSPEAAKLVEGALKDHFELWL